MSNEAVLQVRNLVKPYGRQLALDHLDLDVREGEIFGLLGPNGAGKTTFIKIILGLATPSQGSIRLFGEDLFVKRRRLIRQVGAVVEAPIFFEYMSAWDNLCYLIALSGKVDEKRIREVLAVVGLEDAADKKVGAFSYGMKQRLGIAQALLPDTRFLILDEPTNGLDPHGIAGIRQLVRNLNKKLNITIFLSSHLLVEVERVCHRVAIIHRGRKVLEGDIAGLKNHVVKMRVRLAPESPVPEQTEKWKYEETPADVDSGERILDFQVDRKQAPALAAYLVQAGAEIRELLEWEHSLEDVFLEHTKDGALDARIDTFRN